MKWLQRNKHLTHGIPGIITCNRRRGLEASVIINSGAFIRSFTAVILYRSLACAAEISSARRETWTLRRRRAAVSQLVGHIRLVRRRYGVSDPVDDVEDDEGERKRSSRHSVDVARSVFARFDVDRRRVRYLGRQTPVTQRLDTQQPTLNWYHQVPILRKAVTEGHISKWCFWLFIPSFSLVVIGVAMIFTTGIHSPVASNNDDPFQLSSSSSICYTF